MRSHDVAVPDGGESHKAEVDELGHQSLFIGDRRQAKRPGVNMNYQPVATRPYHPKQQVNGNRALNTMEVDLAFAKYSHQDHPGEHCKKQNPHGYASYNQRPVWRI